MPGSPSVPKADPSAAELGDLSEAFKQAMEGPSLPREPGPPPEVDPEAPHGRDENGVPIEKYGRNKDGTIRRSAAGRKSKDEAARTGPPALQGKQDAAGGPIQTHSLEYYGEKLQEFGTQMWLLIGFVSPADAGALDVNLQPMAEAWAKGAIEDPTVRRAVNYLCSELWISGVLASTIPFVAQVLGNYGRLPEKMVPKSKQAEQRKHLEEMTIAKRELVFAQMAGQEAA